MSSETLWLNINLNNVTVKKLLHDFIVIAANHWRYCTQIKSQVSDVSRFWWTMLPRRWFSLSAQEPEATESFQANRQWHWWSENPAHPSLKLNIWCFSSAQSKMRPSNLIWGGSYGKKWKAKNVGATLDSVWSGPTFCHFVRKSRAKNHGEDFFLLLSCCKWPLGSVFHCYHLVPLVVKEPNSHAFKIHPVTFKMIYLLIVIINNMF